MNGEQPLDAIQQKLVDAIYGPGQQREDSVEELVDSLIALARRAPATGEVTVKPLEWNGDEAKTSIGKYAVRRTPDGYEASFEEEELAHVGFNAVDFHYGARRAAQDHAQADYDYRILAALSAPTPAASAHTLYETGDVDAPDVIKDRNGEVVLALCKVCNRAEIELDQPCTPAPADGLVEPVAGEKWLHYDYQIGEWWVGDDPPEVVRPDAEILHLVPAAALASAEARADRLEAALQRLLLEFDFLIERGHLTDIRNDVIFTEARAAITGGNGHG